MMPAEGGQNELYPFIDTGHSADFSWKEVIKLFSHALPELIEEQGDTDIEALKFLLLNAKKTLTLKSADLQARENARGVQDNITKEVWEQVNSFIIL